MATWPATLPAPLLNSFREQPPENTIRSPMDKGPPKIRRITTANIRPISFSLALTPAQVEILDDFYTTETFSGSVEFYFDHPRTGETFSAVFAERPSYEEREGVDYLAAISLELLP